MDYKTLFPWGPLNLLSETSSYTSHEKIITLRKKKCRFGREDNWIFLDPCSPSEPVCCDEATSPGKPFGYIYATIFQRVHLRLPLSILEKELLTKLNVASAQLHSNSWAFFPAFAILRDQLGVLPSVDVFRYLFEVKKLQRQLWVSVNSVPGRESLPSSNPLIKISKVTFSKSKLTKNTLTSWMVFLYTGLENLTPSLLCA